MHIRATFAVAVLVGTAAFSGRAYAVTGTPTTTANNVPNAVYDEAASDGGYDLTVRVDEALNGLTYTIYRLGAPQLWDSVKGIYEVDCSGFVNRMVEDATPEAYDELRDARNVSRPRVGDYYDFFKSIAVGGTKGRWRRPAHASYLGPGDLLVYRYLVDPGTGATGHSMIVVSSAVRDTTRGSNIYRVRVADSARSGHTNDNRGALGSGVGAGEILVKVDANGQPIAYSWSLTGPFYTDVTLAMGRPRY